MRNLRRLVLIWASLAALGACGGDDLPVSSNSDATGGGSPAAANAGTTSAGRTGAGGRAGDEHAAVGQGGARAAGDGSARGDAGASVSAGVGGSAAADRESDTGGAAAGGGAGRGGSAGIGNEAAAGSASAGRSGGGGAAGVAAAGSGDAGAGIAGSGGRGSTSPLRICPNDRTCKIMPFGDSITDGYNPDTPGGYRIELFRLAQSGGYDITFVGSQSNGPNMVDGVAFSRSHEGHSGWTIAPAGGRSGISTLVSKVMPQYTPDIILLMIGTNDAIDNYDMANAPTRLGALIDDVYTQLPNVTMIVAQLIPARGDASQGDDTGLNARVRAYNDAIPAVVEARSAMGKRVFVVDLYTPFQSGASPLLEDQWHPNAQGYKRIGVEWYAALAPLL